MSADRYLKNKLQHKLQNNIKLARVLAGTVNISVGTQHCNSLEQLTSEFRNYVG